MKRICQEMDVLLVPLLFDGLGIVAIEAGAPAVYTEDFRPKQILPRFIGNYCQTMAQKK